MDIHVVYLRDTDGDFIFDWCITEGESIDASREMVTDFINSDMVSAYCESADIFNLDTIISKTITVPSGMELDVIDEDSEIIYDIISDDYDDAVKVYLRAQVRLFGSLEQSIDDANTVMRTEVIARYGNYESWDDERLAWVIDSLPPSAFRDELYQYYDDIYKV